MKIFDEKGITLIELLATLTISMIILPIIYGVFSSGIKLYNKIQVEGQLRDDADYAVTMVMNTFYSYPFDEVKGCGENCIELINNKETKVEKVPSQSFYTIKENNPLNSETTSIKIKFADNMVNGKKFQEIEIGDKKVDTISNFNQSTISYSCNNTQKLSQISCPGGKDGMIYINLYLSNERLEKPFKLNSQFGF